MKIRKNGRIVRLTESDLKRITKKILREQTQPRFTINIGVGTQQVEAVVSKLLTVDGLQTDANGSRYFILNPSDFSGARISKLTTKEQKIANSIVQSLVSNNIVEFSKGGGIVQDTGGKQGGSGTGHAQGMRDLKYAPNKSNYMVFTKSSVRQR
tara:strand:- start:9122 stop:9583 length:462 start_codon:yes stop_codon:yes gene_type:complete